MVKINLPPSMNAIPHTLVANKDFLSMERREIKFRAWDKQNNRFVSPVFISMHGELFIDRDPYGVDMSGIRKISMLDPDKCIASQFTGLFDKNGKEIYEGDIVRVIDHPTHLLNNTGEVTFKNGRYYVGTETMMSLDEYGTAWTEVIGNIHENPELL